jgi:hypothetical protein
MRWPRPPVPARLAWPGEAPDHRQDPHHRPRSTKRLSHPARHGRLHQPAGPTWPRSRAAAGTASTRGFSTPSAARPLCSSTSSPPETNYMEDLHKAGGVQRLMLELRDQLDETALTVTGRTLGEELDDAPAPFPQNVIRPRSNPIHSGGSIAVLRGNLAPNARSSSSRRRRPPLLEHRGRAVVFEGRRRPRRAHRQRRSRRPRVRRAGPLRNIGPSASPACRRPATSPSAQARQGRVKDKSSAFSTAACPAPLRERSCCTARPRRAVGGPLAIVRTGDTITLSVSRRTLILEVETMNSPAAPPLRRRPGRDRARLRKALRRRGHPRPRKLRLPLPAGRRRSRDRPLPATTPPLIRTPWTAVPVAELRSTSTDRTNTPSHPYPDSVRCTDHRGKTMSTIIESLRFPYWPWPSCTPSSSP